MNIDDEFGKKFNGNSKLIRLGIEAFVVVSMITIGFVFYYTSTFLYSIAIKLIGAAK